MEKCCICGRETENGVYAHLHGGTEAVCPSCLALSMDEKTKSARQKIKDSRPGKINILPGKEDWAPFSSPDNLYAIKTKLRKVK